MANSLFHPKKETRILNLDTDRVFFQFLLKSFLFFEYENTEKKAETGKKERKKGKK